jgi:hypothetical protein
MLTETAPQSSSPADMQVGVQADAQVEEQAEPWYWFTNTRDCGSIFDHEAHPWGALAEREWCKGIPAISNA